MPNGRTNRRSSLFILLVLLCDFAIGRAQTNPRYPDTLAQVTFYSNDVTILGGRPGHQAGGFKGRLFDGDRELAFMEPGHFITFNVAPGTHTFSATTWMAKHSKNGAHLTIDVAAGEHYYVQALFLSANLGSSRFFINQVLCEGAAQEAKHSKPLEPTHLKPDGSPLAVPEAAFPTCS